MAILTHHFRKLHESIINNLDLDSRKEAAILGYPDLIVDKGTLLELLGKKAVSKLSINSRADDIRAHHELPSDFEIYDLLEILDKVYNFNVTVFDIGATRGVEVIVNLNDPIDEKYVKKFDCVIDASVLEHCFNVAQAFKNLCELTKLGGVVSSVNPIYMFNHGYYNINPIMLKDGFLYNGFGIIYRGVIGITGQEIFGFKRKTNPIKVFNLITAKKLVEQEFIFPIQTSKK